MTYLSLKRAKFGSIWPYAFLVKQPCNQSPRSSCAADRKSEGSGHDKWYYEQRELLWKNSLHFSTSHIFLHNSVQLTYLSLKRAKFGSIWSYAFWLNNHATRALVRLVPLTVKAKALGMTSDILSKESCFEKIVCTFLRILSWRTLNIIDISVNKHKQLRLSFW